MSYTRITGLLSGCASRLITLAMVVVFASLAIQPAQAQSSDTWKSVAIIGGSTAAGAYIGHKVAGPTGMWIGAGIGASAGYAIDRRRRQNEYNQYGYYGDQSGYYDPNAGYYPNGGYYPGPYGNAPYPGGLQYRSNFSRQKTSPRR